MVRRRILIVEDDEPIRLGIRDAIQLEGYRSEEATGFQEGTQKALGIEYDLLLLDLILPGGDGLTLLKDVRAVRPAQPDIILAARGDETDRVEGLRLGADDYVVNPFSARELLARVEAVLRRSAERPKDVAQIELPGGQVDLERYEVRFDDGRRVGLSERETELLRYLACNLGRVISRDELMSRVWRIALLGISTRTIDMHIARLRQAR